MDVDDVNSTASSTRRPKAKARPRRRDETVAGDTVIIRYDAAHGCLNIVATRCERYTVCGENYDSIGIGSHDEVMRTVQQMTSARDMARCPADGNGQGGFRPGYLSSQRTNSSTNSHELSFSAATTHCQGHGQVNVRNAETTTSRRA